MILRALAASIAIAQFGAPIQCGHGSDSGVHEESPGDAVWDLAMDLRKSGNEAGARQSLQYLVDKYPSNRHAPEARAELGGAADAAPAK